MEKQRTWVIGLALSLIVVIFVILNTSPVTINFGFAQPKLPLIVVLVIMLLLGAVITFFLGKRDVPTTQKQFVKKLNLQRKELIKQYQKELDDRDRQINKLNEEIASLKQDQLDKNNSKA